MKGVFKMAERRMFSKRIINSAKFLKMPISSQALYFHMGLNADDDGIVEGFPIMRMVGASEDDLRVLVAKGFVTVLNDDLVSYINDWRTHNCVRADRKIDSIYKDLLLQIVPNAEILETKKKVSNDRQMSDRCQSNDNQMSAQDRLGKDRLDKDRLEIPEVTPQTPLLEKTKKSSPKQDIFEEFSRDNVLLLQTLKDFEESRKNNRSKMTDRAKALLISKLESLSNNPNDWISMLNEAILNGWKSVYPLKGNQRKTDDNTPIQQIGEHII